VTTEFSKPQLVPEAKKGGSASDPSAFAEDPRQSIARLEARVAALEKAIERRSRELLDIQRHVCRRDVVVISRIRAGLPPLPYGAYEPAFWHETADLRPADVEETLEDLWSSLYPNDPAP
jgi:hypothetical protein